MNGLVGLGMVGEVGVAPDLGALVAKWRHNQMMDRSGCGRREADWPASGSWAAGGWGAKLPQVGRFPVIRSLSAGWLKPSQTIAVSGRT